MSRPLAAFVALLSVGPLAAPASAAGSCEGAPTTLLPTSDGATIALHHLRGAGPPVLMVHGISSNYRFFCQSADYGLGPALQAAGWDVWLLDLRGHGSAEVGLDGAPQVHGWTVDDYGQADLPAAVAHVQAETGFQRIAYIGHSMGGMVAAVYMASGRAEGNLSTVIALGSPVSFDHDKRSSLLDMGQSMMGFWGRSLRRVNSPRAGRVVARLGPLPGGAADLLYTRDNMPPGSLDPMLRTIASPMSKEELQHFHTMLAAGGLVSADGQIDWVKRLNNVQIPFLGVAGAADNIAAPYSVEAYVNNMGGERMFFLAGTASGLEEDYGHLDLGLGKNVSTELLPRLRAWLGAHAPL